MHPTWRIGTAGWSIPGQVSPAFPGEGHHLQRYARVLNCAEINSSFYRPHSVEVYERWASQTPPTFRFAVKMPATLTHNGPLNAARAPLLRFLSEVAGLGPRLGAILVQLPPSTVFEIRSARAFFRQASEILSVALVCEPRHASWFSPAADEALAALQVTRAAADPARWSAARQPGGWLGPQGDGRGAVLYHRWHGSPRMYWSSYGAGWLRDRYEELQAWPQGAERWCIFDNTAGGAAVSNALNLQGMEPPKRR